MLKVRQTRPHASSLIDIGEGQHTPLCCESRSDNAEMRAGQYCSCCCLK
nr:MAG TPA: hypothetical protein [Bacteriophage sp.]